MDGDRFDRFSVLFAARSRRAALRLLAAGLLGPAALARAPRPAAAAVCRERVPRPGYTPTVNGCGPNGGDWFVPDNWREAEFSGACERHDVCYGTCNSKRAECDDRFLGGLKKACRRAYHEETARDRRLYGDCVDRALMYHAAVEDNGQGAWEDAQEEACLCCNEGGRGPKCGTRCCKTGESCVDGQCKAACADGRATCGGRCCFPPNPEIGWGGEICCNGTCYLTCAPGFERDPSQGCFCR